MYMRKRHHAKRLDMSALQIKQLPVNGYMPNLQRRTMNCPTCAWLGTVNADGYCPVCGKFISDSGQEKPIIADERKVEDVYQMFER